MGGYVPKKSALKVPLQITPKNSCTLLERTVSTNLKVVKRILKFQILALASMLVNGKL